MKTALSRMVGRARMLGAWPPERQFGLGFASKPLINYKNRKNRGVDISITLPTRFSTWRRYCGGIIRANGISYSSKGKQVMAIAAGNSIFAFALP